MLSRIWPGPGGSPGSTSSSPVDSTPTFGRGYTGHVDNAGRGQQPDLRGVETLAGRQYRLTRLHVNAYRTHVVARLHLLSDANSGPVGVRLQPLRLFDHDDRVGPLGQRGRRL